MVCESISYRVAPVTEKARKLALNPNLYVFAFYTVSQALLNFQQNGLCAFHFLGGLFRPSRGSYCNASLGKISHAGERDRWKRLWIQAADFPLPSVSISARTTSAPEVNPPVGVLLPFLKSFPKQRPSMTGRRGERHKYAQVQLNRNCNLITRAQDTFSKLMDTSILIAGRSFEQGNWIRRSGAKELNGRASPTPKSLSMGSSLPLTDISDSPI